MICTAKREAAETILGASLSADVIELNVSPERVLRVPEGEERGRLLPFKHVVKASEAIDR